MRIGKDMSSAQKNSVSGRWLSGSKIKCQAVGLSLIAARGNGPARDRALYGRLKGGPAAALSVGKQEPEIDQRRST